MNENKSVEAVLVRGIEHSRFPQAESKRYYEGLIQRTAELIAKEEGWTEVWFHFGKQDPRGAWRVSAQVKSVQPSSKFRPVNGWGAYGSMKELMAWCEGVTACNR